MSQYFKTSDEIINDLGSDKDGLSSSEVASRVEKYGLNKLDEAHHDGIFKKFLSALADPMIIILICAAVVSAATSFASSEGGFADVIIIMVVVLINAILSVVQESKAEQAIDALKELTAATSKVLRDGKQITVRSEELVPGDIIILEAGDAVPADARIIESASLKAEESAMTGESVPVDKISEPIEPTADGKDIPLGDRKNMLYMGSTVVYGRGTAIVTGTGMNTEMGKIAGVLAGTDSEKTPLQVKLTQLSKVLTWLVLGICVVIFAVSLLKAGDFHLGVILDTFIIAVSLAVAAIPEGLAAVVTIDLSIGVTRMSKQGAVIRRLSAVETLGCTQIICSDKTGTLTQNKMTVVETADAPNEKLLCTAMALCCDASLDENNQAVGEPTECALVNFACKSGCNKSELEKKQPRIGEIPFDSGRKLMTTVHTVEGKILQYTKGAPDVLLALCTKYFDGQSTKPMTDEKRKEILASNKALADKALRVLAAAYKVLPCEPEEYSPEKMECELIFCGLCGMIDPVRPEVKEAIEECRSAGIRPIMITGDHRDTAVAIAKELGIITDESEAITGSQLDDISDEDFAKRVQEFSVYARVQPEHKTRIVKAWKALGMVTAMTGDGVNDAPSIKTADIGVGMGITGTDVTKNVADMILSDDNFATIVKAAEEGRRIYDNIRRAIRFLLSSNMAEVLAVFVASIIGFTIMEAKHLLWINLITDCFPALALGLEVAENNIMKRPPRKNNEGIFAGGMGTDIAYQGILIGIVTLAAYFIGHFYEGGTMTDLAKSPDGMTMAFLTMSMAEIFHSYNMRAEYDSIFSTKSHNFYLFGAMIFSFIMTASVIYIPFLNNAFDFAAISFTEYAIAIGLALLVIPVVEIVKIFKRASLRRKHLINY